jgi:hypothetical protein
MSHVPEGACTSCGQRLPLDRDACPYCAAPLDCYWFHDSQGMQRAVVFTVDGRECVFFGGETVPLGDASRLPAALRHSIVADAAKRRAAARERAIVAKAVIGPDGFPCREDDTDEMIHLLLNDYLCAMASAGARPAPPLPSGKNKSKSRDAQAPGDDKHRAVISDAISRMTEKLDRSQRARIVEAIERRVEWIGGHASSPAVAQWRSDLQALVEPFAAAAGRASDADNLRDMLDGKSDSALRYCLGGTTAEFLRTYELTPELYEGLRPLREKIKKFDWDGVHFQRMNIMQNLYVLLWHDEWDVPDFTACATNVIRGDFRAMTGERRAHWRALFRDVAPLNSYRLSKRWAKAAQRLLADLGIEEFRDRVREWFGTFRAPDPRWLTVGGGHVLKELVWYAALSRDSATIEAVMWFTEATWKVDKVCYTMLEVLPETQALPPRQMWEGLIRPCERGIIAAGTLERAAATLGIDKEELRRRGLLTPSSARAARAANGADDAARS